MIEPGLVAVEWPEEDKGTYVDEHTKGWEIHLASLHDYLARPSDVTGAR